MTENTKPEKATTEKTAEQKHEKVVPIPKKDGSSTSTNASTYYWGTYPGDYLD